MKSLAVAVLRGFLFCSSRYLSVNIVAVTSGVRHASVGSSPASPKRPVFEVFNRRGSKTSRFALRVLRCASQAVMPVALLYAKNCSPIKR